MSFKKTFTSRFTKHLAAVMAVFSAPIVLSGTAHAQGNNWGDRLVETIVDSSARQLCKNFFDAENTRAARGVCRGYGERFFGESAQRLGFNYDQNDPLSLTFNRRLSADDDYWDNYYNADSRGYFMEDGFATPIIDYTRCSSPAYEFRDMMYGRQDPDYCDSYPVQYQSSMERQLEQRLGRDWQQQLTARPH